jgi:hypothetical protein
MKLKFIAIACLLALPLMAESAKKSSAKAKVADDATRLAAILNDVQNQRTTFSEATWKSTVNEANMLANRVYARTGGRAAARDLRMHVREMRKAALKGDAAGARQHASEALPFAYQVIDWAS